MSRPATSQSECRLTSKFFLLQITDLGRHEAGFGKQQLSSLASGSSTAGRKCRSQNCAWHLVWPKCFSLDIKVKKPLISEIHTNPAAMSAWYWYQEESVIKSGNVPHPKQCPGDSENLVFMPEGIKGKMDRERKRNGLTVYLTMIQLSRKTAPLSRNLYNFVEVYAWLHQHS